MKMATDGSWRVSYGETRIHQLIVIMLVKQSNNCPSHLLLWIVSWRLAAGDQYFTNSDSPLNNLIRPRIALVSSDVFTDVHQLPNHRWMRPSSIVGLSLKGHLLFFSCSLCCWSCLKPSTFPAFLGGKKSSSKFMASFGSLWIHHYQSPPFMPTRKLCSSDLSTIPHPTSQARASCAKRPCNSLTSTCSTHKMMERNEVDHIPATMIKY